MAYPTVNALSQPAMMASSLGEKSLAGLMAAPALSPRLRWMAVRPRPMMRGAVLGLIPRLCSSVTERMISSSRAVPSIWSMAREASPT